jgi:hypothetical protein
MGQTMASQEQLLNYRLRACQTKMVGESGVAGLHDSEHIILGSSQGTNTVAKVAKDGLLNPRSLLRGITTVEIRRKKGRITLVAPPKPDPIRKLGRKPVPAGCADGAVRHAAYLHGRGA